MTEKLLDDKLCRYAKEEGGIAIKLFSLSFTGFPDRTVLLPGGRICFAEIKTESVKKLRPRQGIVRTMLEKLGFKYFVVNSEESLNLFRGFIKQK